MPKRDTYNYTFRNGRKVSHRGVTNNPERREKEHQRATVLEGNLPWTAGQRHDKARSKQNADRPKPEAITPKELIRLDARLI